MMMMTDLEGLSSDELIAVDALMALNIPSTQPLRPTPTPNDGSAGAVSAPRTQTNEDMIPTSNNDGDGGGGGGGGVSALRAPIIAPIRKARSRQVIAKGIKEAKEDCTKELFCRTKTAMLLPHLGLKPYDINTYLMMPSSSVRPQLVKNKNKNQNKKMTSTSKGSGSPSKKSVEKYSAEDLGGPEQEKVAPIQLVIGRIQPSSDIKNENLHKGTKRKLTDAGSEAIQHDIASTQNSKDNHNAMERKVDETKLEDIQSSITVSQYFMLASNLNPKPTTTADTVYRRAAPERMFDLNVSVFEEYS